jgi:hypothetical protein
MMEKRCEGLHPSKGGRRKVVTRWWPGMIGTAATTFAPEPLYSGSQFGLLEFFRVNWHLKTDQAAKRGLSYYVQSLWL